MLDIPRYILSFFRGSKQFELEEDGRTATHFWSLVLISDVILESLELTNLRESKKNYVDGIGQVSFRCGKHC